ncbi:hypothetical protein A2U01_0086893 [Trifolium medium]|uniref:Uncharacterized protein n=1 Tax=Trifolium medium TaxID=97028 RepID=A0A392U0N6_9FABA|nr:hypothetical protein [Trifolium medium]
MLCLERIQIRVHQRYHNVDQQMIIDKTQWRHIPSPYHRPSRRRPVILTTLYQLQKDDDLTGHLK